MNKIIESKPLLLKQKKYETHGWMIAIGIIAVIWIFYKMCNSDSSYDDNIKRMKQDSIDNANKIKSIPQVSPAQKFSDSIANVRQDSIEKVEQKKYDKTKAGKIQKKHPEWDKEDCERVANNRIWIGMSFYMLTYERGRPNRATPSNYGSGNHWQWCWDDYTPSCFYGDDDGIITSYN